MTKKLIQGQGIGTEYKQRRIGAALKVSLDLSMSKNVRPWPYYHIDLNCGCGFNAMAGCIGSPVVFLQQAALCGRDNYYAFFVDKDPGAIENLEQVYLQDYPRAYSWCMDNSEMLPIVEEFILKRGENPLYAMGSILCDPNGYIGETRESAVPYASIIEFAARFPRFDIIFNMNVMTYRWGKGHIDRGTKGWTGKFWPSPRDFGALFHRPYWLVTNVVTGRSHPFVLMIGRSMKTGDHRSLGWYHLDGIKGQAILDQIDRAQGDDSRQVNLFPSLPNLSGISEAPGVFGRARGCDEAREGDVRDLPTGTGD